MITDVQALLINLLNPTRDREDTAEVLPSLTAEDWQLIQPYVESHSLANSVFARLRQQELLGLIPEENRVLMRENYLANAARNSFLLNSAQKAFAVLAARGIPVIGLKGLYLLENVFKDVGARAMNDLDILVQKQDIASALSALKSISCEPLSYFDSNAANLDIKHVPPMSLPDGTTIEIHWTLLEENEPFNINPESLWQRSVPARFADMDARALSTEDLLLHLCLHATYQHYLKLGLRGMFDLALVLQKEAERIDWDKLSRTARDWGVEKIAALSLALLQEIDWVQLPDKLPDGLKPAALDAEFVTQAKSLFLLENHNPSALTPDLAELSASESLLEKGNLILRRIFLPKAVIARLYNINPRSPGIVLGYFRRVFDLVQQHGGTFTKLFNSDQELTQNMEQEKIRYQIHQWLTSR